MKPRPKYHELSRHPGSGHWRRWISPRGRRSRTVGGSLRQTQGSTSLTGTGSSRNTHPPSGGRQTTAYGGRAAADLMGGRCGLSNTGAVCQLLPTAIFSFSHLNSPLLHILTISNTTTMTATEPDELLEEGVRVVGPVSSKTLPEDTEVPEGSPVVDVYVRWEADEPAELLHVRADLTAATLEAFLEAVEDFYGNDQRPSLWVPGWGHQKTRIGSTDSFREWLGCCMRLPYAECMVAPSV